MNAREILRKAAGGESPDVSRLVERVPALMAEARLRRGESPAPWLAAPARRAIPKLAIATAAALVLAIVASVAGSDSSTKSPVRFDSLVLTGSSGDVLLEAVLAAEAERG